MVRKEHWEIREWGQGDIGGGVQRGPRDWGTGLLLISSLYTCLNPAHGPKPSDHLTLR